MTLDMFLDLGAVKGESQDKVHAGKIEVLAWSWGVSNPATAHTGGGGGSWKAVFQDLAITKYIDSSSSELLQSVSLGKHFPEATLIVRKTGADKKLDYYTIVMKGVTVTSYQTGGSGSEDRLTESLTLSFTSIETRYHAQGAKGRRAGGSTFAHDVTENVPG